MYIKKISIFALSLMLNANLFSMEITNGQQYINKETGKIVTIKGSCKEIWDIDSLAEVGDSLGIPGILKYCVTCIKKSEIPVSGKINFLNQEELKRVLNPKFHGLFYYAICDNSGECVHPSWLKPIK